MSTRRYQLLENIVVESQLLELLKGYIPTTESSEIVSGIQSTTNGIVVIMKDGYQSTIPVSQAKAFEEVILDEETGLLHFYDANREDVFDPIYFGNVGGGGGSSSMTYSISFKNLSESRSFSVAQGTSVVVQTEYSSVDEDGVDDGPGVGTIYVGGVRKATINISQGVNDIDVTKYLISGSNSVKIKVENSDGMSKSITYTVNVISLSVTTTLSQFIKCSGDTSFYYRVVGDGTKTVHFKMDGVEIGTAIVEGTGKSQTYIIPAQSHGGHVFECYATTVFEGISIQSEPICLGMIWVDSSNAMPAIIMLSDTKTATQGESLFIPYMAYDPMTETPVVTYTIFNEDGTEYSKQEYTIDGTTQEWITLDYPIGNTRFRISIGGVYAETTIAVAESTVKIETIQDSLVLDFNPKGRSNQEDNPEVWTDGNVTATFADVGFAGSDGWLNDSTGSTMLRLLPGGEMTIPFSFFAADKRDAGATIEVEMATHNVRDYDSVVISCLSGGRGIKIASQYAQLNSEQSEISMQFVEDKRVRVSFVIEPKNLNRLIYVYVNGIGCGAIQYPEDDNFAQNPAAGITIGAESSGIDVYRILMYEKGLVATELTGNFVADRPTLAERLEAHRRNDILDTSEDIVISKLPSTLPYMIISCAELPQYKGDKKTCTIEYVNPADPSRNFRAENVQIDVQGTSSAGYKKKNFKPKFKDGIIYSSTGLRSDGYAIREGQFEVDCICLKADVASSEGANNVELVRLYNDICPYKTAAQEADSRVRVGIDGVACIVFWNNTDTGVTKFWGKYNLNNEKSNHEVYGLADGCESWEICNNTSNRVVFKESDFTKADWVNDFEARYPEDNTDYTNLKRMTDWVASTNRFAVETEEEKQALLDKFKAEFEDYFIKDAMIFYYVFTETFLMVDNRAKNFFPTTYDGLHWMPLPYDMDTAIGINNEGQLVFDYDLEDTDRIGSANVYNGQESVLWCNIRDAFPDEIKEMYSSLRSTTNTLFAYDKIIERFEEHQSVWPETVWNEDAYEKYLEPLLSDKDGSYLAMMQGDKSSQREWWLYNGFRYRDSKYQCGDASNHYITLRCYATGDITVTPYSHIWPRIKYGSYTVTERGKRNVATTLTCPLDEMNDTEVYIYSADRLADIGDLSGLKVGYANFTPATKLQKLKLGDGSADYQNTNLTEVYVGNNELLTELDVRNCVNLKQAVDVSDCASIERIYADGSSVTAILLPVGGKVKHLELPNTVTNFTIRNHKQFETLDIAGYDSLTTLRVENTPNVPIEDIIINAPKLERVRLLGLEWTATSEENLQAMINKLEACGGLDASTGNTDKAVVNGRVNIGSISGELLDHIYETFPELIVVVNGEVNYVVRYVDVNGTIIYKQLVAEGDNAVDPVEAGLIDAPIKEGGEDIGYTFSGWSNLPTNIHSNTVVYAQFTEAYAVRFYNGDTLINTQWIVSGENAVDPVETGDIETPTKEGTDDLKYLYSGWDKIFTNITAPTNIYAQYTNVWAVRFYNGNTLLNTQWITDGEDAIDPVSAGTVGTPTKESTAQYSYSYSGWDITFTNISDSTNVYAQFTSTVRTYNVYFYNDNVLLQTHENIAYGSSVSYLGDTPVKDAEDAEDYEFTGWSPELGPITGETYYYAQYRYSGLISVKLVERTLSGDYTNETIESVGSYAFCNMTGLTSVHMPNVSSVEEYAFYKCNNLESVTLPNVTIFGDGVLRDCIKIVNIDFPELLRVNGQYTFNGMKELANVNLPKLISGGKYMFQNCSKLTSIELPSLAIIGDSMFVSTSGLTTARFPIAHSISSSCFYVCRELTDIEIPLVTTISYSAFKSCFALTKIDLPLVNNIGGEVFYGCSKLVSVMLRNTETVCSLYSTNAFTNTPIKTGTGYIYVPSALIEEYKVATNWSTYANQFRALEDYTVDGTITGTLDENKI